MSGNPDNLTSLTLVENWYVPRNQMYMMGQQVVIHPYTAMVLRNGGRHPLYTRHMLGEQELERDRRRRTK